MQSHLKHSNSIFKQIDKNLNIIQAPQRKKKIALNIICKKSKQCPILLCFGVYTPTQYALSCKIQKVSI